MKKENSLAKLLMRSLLWTVCILAFYVAGGAIAQTTKQGVIGQNIIQGIAVWLSVITAVIYLKVKKKSFQDTGFCAPKRNSLKSVYYYIPILMIEATGFLVGLRELNVGYCIATVFMTVAVGFSEEIYFRGFIFNGLLSLGAKKAILACIQLLSYIFFMTFFVTYRVPKSLQPL